jgi:hypothetical protein
MLTNQPEMKSAQKNLQHRDHTISVSGLRVSIIQVFRNINIVRSRMFHGKCTDGTIDTALTIHLYQKAMKY